MNGHHNSEGLPTVPVIDFGPWDNSDKQEERLKVARELTAACRNVGFVQIINHGLPDDVLQEAFAWSKKLFDLPMEQKMLAPHPDGPNVHRGYSYPGLEKVGQVNGTNGDDSKAEEALRQVTDCKVSVLHASVPLPA